MDLPNARKSRQFGCTQYPKRKGNHNLRFGPTISRRCVLGGAISAVALGNPLQTKSAAVRIRSPQVSSGVLRPQAIKLKGLSMRTAAVKASGSFAHTVGRVKNGDTGDVACDHYHRWREDVEFISRCGFGAYRFSTSWPRILPTGNGTIERRGLDFYDRLVDGLIARGIAPWLCLYHWDLPQALQEQGGWLNRDIVQKFAEYGRIVARRLGDRVKHWAILNEPNVHALFGHGTGSHAPGFTGLPNMLAAIHHQNLAQGVALQALRAERSALILGTVLSLQPARPSSDRNEDYRAAERFDAMWNGACLDPLLRGSFRLSRRRLHAAYHGRRPRNDAPADRLPRCKLLHSDVHYPRSTKPIRGVVWREAPQHALNRDGLADRCRRSH